MSLSNAELEAIQKINIRYIHSMAIPKADLLDRYEEDVSQLLQIIQKLLKGAAK